MSETIETIEIAKAIKSGLDTALASVTILNPAGDALHIPVYASGVSTDEDGNIDEEATENERRNPHVAINIREHAPLGYRSAMLHYPGTVAAVTHFGDDPFKVVRATLSRAVANYLSGPPTLTLTLRKFDSLVIDAAPESGVDEQLQFMEWPITVHTGPAAETEE